MKKLLVYVLNGLFFSVVIVLAVSVATIALTRKINRYRSQFQNGLQVTVIKKEVPVLSYTRGIVKRLPARVGQEVKKNTILAHLDNPALRSRATVLGAYEDNVSAQTEAKIAEEELKGLIIRAPVDGVIAEVHTTEGSPIETFSRFISMYSNADTKLLAQLTVEQYHIIKKLPEVRAYSPRLNQNFMLKPHMLSPDEQDPDRTGEKKIGLYFKLANEQDGTSLLHNEDLDITIDATGGRIVKPVDYFVDFWNGLLILDSRQRG